jgi:tetratricopeptide (TPR) repeat protein
MLERMGKAHQAVAEAIELGATASSADLEEGRVWRERIGQLVTGVHSTGTRIAVPLWLAQVVDAFIRRGLHDAAEGLLEDAFAVLEQTGERAWEAELYRLRGELLRERRPEAAEAAFGEALAVARRQGALAFELRAAMGLAGLLAAQGRESEARAVLAPVYARFTEGFDTIDLRAAREMLARLGAPV